MRIPLQYMEWIGAYSYFFLWLSCFQFRLTHTLDTWLLATHRDAVMMEIRVRLELVRRVVLVGGQQLAQSQAFDVGLCGHVERETGDGFHTSPGALGRLLDRGRYQWVDIEVVRRLLNKATCTNETGFALEYLNTIWLAFAEWICEMGNNERDEEITQHVWFFGPALFAQWTSVVYINRRASRTA